MDTAGNLVKSETNKEPSETNLPMKRENSKNGKVAPADTTATPTGTNKGIEVAPPVGKIEM